MKKNKRGIFNYDYLNLQIKDYLKYCELDLNDLAIKIGLSKKTLKRTLKNKRCFYLNEMYKIIDTLHIKTEDINKTFFNINNKEELLSDITPLNKGGVINE